MRLGRVREVKNDRGLVSVHVMRPAVSASWQLSELGLCPLRDWRQRHFLPDDGISKEWLQVREKDASGL